MINGIDLSHHNNVTGFGSIYGAGIDFAICKATEGLTVSDMTFPWKMTNAKAAGLVTGAYHFFHPADDPIKQAEFFLKTVEPYMPCLLAVDLEFINGGEWASLAENVRTDAILRFLLEIKTNVKGLPLVYEGAAFHNQNYPKLDLSMYPLWLARYAATPGNLPPFFDKWTMWQGSETGTVPGIVDPNSVDLDFFNGDIQALQALKCWAV